MPKPSLIPNLCRLLPLFIAVVVCSVCVGDERQRTRIVLAGDSTVTDSSGWGIGFQACLAESVECINMAKGGRSSRSFRAEGLWDKCLKLKPDYLLIQFGHNDQPGKGPERESAADGDFRDHLRRYVEEAKAIDCKPVLITSLTRRRWNDQGKIQPTLAAYAEATKIVAAEMSVPLLDLNRLSIEQCNRIGPEAFRAFEPMTVEGADHTHLNQEGSLAVGAIVAKELAEIVKPLANVIRSSDSKDDLKPDRLSLQTTNNELTLAQSEATLSIQQNGKPVLVYNKQSPPLPDGMNPAYRRSGFLHPVATPVGDVVTATFPADHPHQHGIFSAWVRASWNDRKIDFWNLAKETGRVLHQRVVSTFVDGRSIGFEVDLVHRSQQAPIVDILRERWKLTVHPTDGSYHCFDLLTVQTAITDIPLIVKEYHYGGMAYRGLTQWVIQKPKKGQPVTDAQEPNSFSNDLGSDRKQGNHEKAKWVTLQGTIEGRQVSITVMNHPENFRSPQPARLHPSKPYFCFAPCVEGEFVIDKDTPLTGRYRYLVTDNKPQQEWLSEQWQQWVQR